MIAFMESGQTTAAIQRYLEDLGGADRGTAAETIVRGLLARAAFRLRTLCASLLHRSYGRLAAPPLNLESDEMLGAVVERLMRAMKEVRPGTVRQFFALANRHMRWELNDLARKLDGGPRTYELGDRSARTPEDAEAGAALSRDALRMTEAIERLPEDEREAFGLVRIQGMMHTEAAAILGVSAKTVQRRLNRALMLLAVGLEDLSPDDGRRPRRPAVG